MAALRDLLHQIFRKVLQNLSVLFFLYAVKHAQNRQVKSISQKYVKRKSTKTTELPSRSSFP